MRSRQRETRDSTSPEPSTPAAFSRLAEGAFHARLAATAGIAVVLFSAPNCGACRAWKHLLPLALVGLASAMYEVDVSEATGVARYFGIFHLPTLYLYKDGQFHAELQCEARREAIQQAVQRLLAAPAQDEP
ncbi:MAG: thioredoxin family protein [Gammaproteobacteria bacterium]|nr:thioredoxin family protein [Gammaproteobacteria bacterium]